MKKRIIGVSAAAICAAAGLLYIFFTKNGAGAGIPCTLHFFTGYYCPGCGASRALRALLHLDFYQALRYNALFTVCAPFVGIYTAVFVCRYIRFGKIPVKRKLPLWPLWVLCAVAIVYGILRNLPEFAFLAPTMLG